MNKKQTGGYSTKVKITDKRNSKIIKYKKDKRLLADEPSEGGVFRTKIKKKWKKGELKKMITKVIDKEGSRKTKTKMRVTRKGVVKKKTVVWEDGKRKVIKTRDGKVVKKKGYQTGGFLEAPIEEI